MFLFRKSWKCIHSAETFPGCVCGPREHEPGHWELGGSSGAWGHVPGQPCAALWSPGLLSRQGLGDRLRGGPAVGRGGRRHAAGFGQVSARKATRTGGVTFLCLPGPILAAHVWVFVLLQKRK